MGSTLQECGLEALFPPGHAPFPRRFVTRLMCHGKDDDRFLVDREVDRIREPRHQRPSHLIEHLRIHEWFSPIEVTRDLSSSRKGATMCDASRSYHLRVRNTSPRARLRKRSR